MISKASFRNSNNLKNQRGTVLAALMAVIAALGLIGTISARQLFQHQQLAKRAFEKAVLHNLAEAGISHALTRIQKGKNPQGRVFSDEPVGKFTGFVEVTGLRQKEGWLLTSKAKLQKPRGKSLFYEIEAHVERSGKHFKNLSWEEKFFERVPGNTKTEY